MKPDSSNMRTLVNQNAQRTAAKASFRDLRLKDAYDSDEDNVLEDFYIPVLAKSVRYDRLAGYFSSTTLATSAKGMADFIENDGKMRLITSADISEHDMQAILDGMAKPEEVIANAFLKKFDMVDNLQRYHIAALSWMISQGNLEIKIAIPNNKQAFHNPVSLYHQKTGILYDAENRRIAFSGSINETGNAWNENIEEFKVFCDWKYGQEAYGDNDAKRFEKFWHNNSVNTKVYSLPDAIKSHLVKLAPKTKKEAADMVRAVSDLRSYQYEAMEQWFKNDCCGILEMATGTGKTRTAIACINKIFKTNERCMVVIACPNNHLIHQWAENLKTWGLDTQLAYSDVKWTKDLKDGIYHINNHIISKKIITTTHKTFCSKRFGDIINTCKTNMMVVVDEVHGAGANKTKLGLLARYKYRLGLSATPKRYFDESGTELVSKYFRDVVFKFNLDDAIRQGYLARYKFFPKIAYLTTEETNKFHKLSRQIAIEKNKLEPDLKKVETLQFKRANIVKSASHKIDVFANILDEMSQPDHCLIYCADGQQIKNAFPILNKKGIMSHQFTQQESDGERIALLDEFARGIKPALLAIRCLDEGVDVPSAMTAILLASSGNPREFVQRRGRILRMHDGKEHAVIYDIIALPEYLPADAYNDSDQTLITKELSRLKEFARSSENPKTTTRLISILKAKYKLEATP